LPFQFLICEISRVVAVALVVALLSLMLWLLLLLCNYAARISEKDDRKMQRVFKYWAQPKANRTGMRKCECGQKKFKKNISEESRRVADKWVSERARELPSSNKNNFGFCFRPYVVLWCECLRKEDGRSRRRRNDHVKRLRYMALPDGRGSK